MHDEGIYICPHCGEEIVVTLDPSAGREQRYTEDCPVCCNPNVVAVNFDEDGEASVSAEPE
jgi:hypothetical protein